MLGESGRRAWASKGQRALSPTALPSVPLPSQPWIQLCLSHPLGNPPLPLAHAPSPNPRPPWGEGEGVKTTASNSAPNP